MRMMTTNKEILGNILVLIDKIDKTKDKYNGYDDFIENDDFLMPSCCASL
jgi:hypothetical protein